jgi:glycosyltransferase involved in cell wall biosynthesis
MISIILATYNTADYLERCVNSIINQTYKDLEIIIVNDGSTDNTAEILNEFQQKDCRIKMIHQENKGHSEARNVGMDNAHGDYYFFIDSDDYLHRQAIEILWNNMQETGADISIGNTTREKELETTLENDYYVYSTMDALSILTDYHSPLQRHKLPFTATWNKIFKASLFSNVRFPTGHIRDDNFTCHRLIYNAKKIVFTKAKTYFYTYREGSVSNKGLINKDFMLAYK